MALFPIFVKLAGRPALVVGGGGLAAAKIETLLASGAVVTVIAAEISSPILARSDQGEIEWVRRDFENADVLGKVIVFAASGVREIDRAVFAVCTEAGVLCNAIDDPQYCDFYSPAIVRRGDLQIAISTNGQSPALAQQIRQELETRFDPSWKDRIAELGSRRREVLRSMAAGEERVRTLHAQASAELRRTREGLIARTAAAVQKWLNTEDERDPLI
jgi:precorrin-2 dehydrogenase/sirohydrochlorin ferrochelatase